MEPCGCLVGVLSGVGLVGQATCCQACLFLMREI